MNGTLQPPSRIVSCPTYQVRLHWVVTEGGEFTNLILAGPAGVGKTSVARALCNELEGYLLFVNASNDRGIDDIRNTDHLCIHFLLDGFQEGRVVG